ncbi:hypothetical protein I7I51_03299 [Histoplasma capsulatum]|uniref:Uncharacterized protein n=1 Tax=Ajellomyces capsulatus TaxID=5037 RepID=A0A8A1MAB7_AJECA|nr:hypothetical protein I7I51_03299 [Histoplasma capsulatum]
MDNLDPQDSSAAMRRHRHLERQLSVSKGQIKLVRRNRILVFSSWSQILVTGKKNCRYKGVTGCHRLPYDKEAQSDELAGLHGVLDPRLGQTQLEKMENAPFLQPTQ